MTSWNTYLADNQASFLEELFDFIRIPSVSALPEHADDVQHAAEWVAERLNSIGIENVQVLPTGGHPVVYGDWLHAPGNPTILIYGHFDTQPPGNPDLWETPPFEPSLRGRRLYARGASDDKGSMFIPILAVEALLQTTATLPLNVKFFFEGQEEIGSPTLPEFVAAHKERLSCDLVVSADGLQWAADQPMLLIGLKGICAVQIDVLGPKHDLHSGLHGGGVQNPIHALVQLLDSMRSPTGEILVAGFYDDVIPLSDIDRQDIARPPFDEAEYLSELGIDVVFGELGYTTRERLWARPTLEINGIWGGFEGDGTMTIVPSEAHAKITCRLVADQEPGAIANLLIAHIEKHTPLGVTITVQSQEMSADPFLIPADHPGNQVAGAVLEELYGKAPYITRLGGSIPVASLFLKELDAYMVGFGFSVGDENLHGPNEFLRLDNFERGQRGYCLLLERLATLSL